MVTEKVSYDYDYLNQLTSREHDTDDDQGSTDLERTQSVYQDGQVVLQFEKTGSGEFTDQDLARRYLWGPVVDQLLADEWINWSNGQANGDTFWAPSWTPHTRGIDPS